MSIVIRPKNWNDFQHYKDRNPPWIKLHKSLLDNYEFHALQLASKALAPCYWLLASEHPEGLITVDEKKLAWRFRCDEKTIRETVKELISSGFFEVVQDASNALAGCKQDAMPETETETETETKKKARAGARFVPPPWVDQQLWADFMEMRKAIKKPATDRAQELLVIELQKLMAQGFTQQDILNNSIRNNWQDLYVPKTKAANGSNGGFVC